MGIIYDNNGEEQDKEYFAKKVEYMNYILQHTRNVKTAYGTLFASKNYSTLPSKITTSEWSDALKILRSEVLEHDQSKYGDEEFEAYRRHFYPTKKESENQDPDVIKKEVEDFKKAWEHHYRNNDHHPQYWKYIGPDNTILEQPSVVGVPMPLYAVMHMICDWWAMDKQQGITDHTEWYKGKHSEEERKCLNPETKLLLVDMFKLLYGEDVSSTIE